MTATLDQLIGTVSPSRLETAQRCLAQFLFRYVERRPERFNASMQFGNAADAASGESYRDKMRTGRTPSAKDVQARFADEWDWAATAVDDWGEEKRGDLLDVGTRAMATWRDRIADFVQPAAVQEDLTQVVTDATSGDSFALRGIIDVRGVAAALPVVADLKTSGKLYRADTFQRKFQPTAYTLLTGTPTFQYHVLTTQRTPQTQVLQCAVADHERVAFLRRAAMLRRQVATAFRTGDWLPNRTHTLCSRRYCDHWETCEKRFGGRVAP